MGTTDPAAGQPAGVKKHRGALVISVARKTHVLHPARPFAHRHPRGHKTEPSNLGVGKIKNSPTLV